MSSNHNLSAKKIIDEDNFFIKKKFSQNFLLDENIIKNIIKESKIDKNSYVIEIGPGLGALTKYIVDQAKKVLIYEVDKDLIPILEGFFKDKKNIKIINQDFLKSNINNDIELYLDGSKNISLISNLPYHITTPIIMKVLEETENIRDLTLMMQLEVGQRLTSKPNTKDYNALSIIVQDQADVKYLFKVPKTVFKPRPQVDSAVIRLERKDNFDDFDKTDFYKFLHNSFSQRRKTLINNLSENYKDCSKQFFKNLLERNNIIDTIRGEALDVEEFKKIFRDFIKERNSCI
ncbi:MAG: ribosomal RNA small subunit methyltransferase A [Tenericutes bacterium HGW-Tenericutes-5]|jgi:16S rRNA (adenine1518-N6/adenine1519-N6)-dimethyltransferase|nr:MAG: ribosomal RNA small subunit methyltransferase A [Tenericutes bacterium HGW-Tenericutes-5]